jgi:iron complex transport system substrate-binding protein
MTSAKAGIGGPLSTSREIDQGVRDVLRAALAVYDIDVVALERARPDVILTQDLCDVCAVSYDDVVSAVRAIAGASVRIVNLHPTRLSDIWSDIRTVGAALGREREADALVQGLLARVEVVRERASGMRSRHEATAGSSRTGSSTKSSSSHASTTHGSTTSSAKTSSVTTSAASDPGAKVATATGSLGASRTPNVLTIEWIDPVMVGGTWMPELVEIAGGRALVTQPGDHAPTLSVAELRALDPAPDVVVIKPCGFQLERTLRETQTLRDLFAQLDWPALRTGSAWIADGNAYFNRPGPRIADSLEIMAACVHPDLFPDFADEYAGRFVRMEELARCT